MRLDPPPNYALFLPPRGDDGQGWRKEPLAKLYPPPNVKWFMAVAVPSRRSFDMTRSDVRYAVIVHKEFGDILRGRYLKDHGRSS
jgi:hypothetical protein